MEHSILILASLAVAGRAGTQVPIGPAAPVLLALEPELELELELELGPVWALAQLALEPAWALARLEEARLFLSHFWSRFSGSFQVASVQEPGRAWVFRAGVRERAFVWASRAQREREQEQELERAWASRARQEQERVWAWA